ncbi:MAG: glutamyl-tRNA reductase [Spirochaetes bacterium GWF1_51_8]|nr:MAG: glutamyl-tRNA reductase [Spirochaetes bacterium GWF1_51_8]
MIRLNGIDARQTVDARERFFEQVCSGIGGDYIILRTCDRVEVYTDDGRPSPAPIAAARHLFRVAAGLESPFVGEAQILHQLRKAYEDARKAGHVSAALHRLFQSALHAGKKARSGTNIGRGAVSHSQAAAEIVTREAPNLSSSVITFIGVNRLNRGMIRFLAARGSGAILVGNRTWEHARQMADELHLSAFHLDDLADVLARTNILISAPSAPHLIVKTAQFPAGRPMLILDLAVPRDIDETIGGLPGVTLYNIEDVEKRALHNLEVRRKEIESAEEIVENELNRYIVEYEKRRMLKSV